MESDPDPRCGQRSMRCCLPVGPETAPGLETWRAFHLPDLPPGVGDVFKTSEFLLWFVSLVVIVMFPLLEKVCLVIGL